MWAWRVDTSMPAIFSLFMGTEKVATGMSRGEAADMICSLFKKGAGTSASLVQEAGDGEWHLVEVDEESHHSHDQAVS